MSPFGAEFRTLLGTARVAAASNSLFAWGKGLDGMTGLGDIVNRSSPVQVGTLTTWKSLTADNYHSLAVKSDNTLWAWGRNLYGQLGQGDVVYRSSPVQVGALTTWSKVATGSSAVLAIKTDGTLWTWGRNQQGQLGQGDVVLRSSPVQVGTLTNWSSVSCSSYFSMAAVKTDGTLWAWGKNRAGACGLGDTVARSSPVQVGALTTWSKVNMAGMDESSLAIKTDGTLWSLGGYNSYGGLGQGDVVARSSPVQVGTLTTWSEIVAGRYHSLAIKTDNTLWTWGRNDQGQLGQGNVTNLSSPVQVGTLTNWASVFPGHGKFSIAHKIDGTLWTWGQNATFGHLGLGDVTNRSSPVQVGALTTWISGGAAGRYHGGAIRN